MKLKIPKTILFFIPLLFLVAAGCSGNGSTLSRPSAERNTNENSITNSVSNSKEENGEVAGVTTEYKQKNIKVNNINLQVDLADTDALREQGLSGREKLETGTGMLFDFSNTDFRKPGFWMKDMNFPIDIIWITNGKVLYVVANVPVSSPDVDLPVYYPPTDITHVLEVPAGWSEQNKITTGSAVSI